MTIEDAPTSTGEVARVQVLEKHVSELISRICDRALVPNNLSEYDESFHHRLPGLKRRLYDVLGIENDEAPGPSPLSSTSSSPRHDPSHFFPLTTPITTHEIRNELMEMGLLHADLRLRQRGAHEIADELGELSQRVLR